MHEYNIQARAYWWTVFGIGCVLLAMALWSVIQLPLPSVIQIALVGAAAGVVGFFPLTIPRTKIAIAAGEIFIFLLLLLFGVEAALLVAAIEAFVASRRSSKRWTSWFGSPAFAAISVFVAGSFFVVVKASLISAGWWNSASLLLVLTAFAVLYFLISAALPSILLALKNSTPLSPVSWYKGVAWIAVANVGCAAIAALLYEAARQFGMIVLLSAVPFIVMLFGSTYLIFERTRAHEKTQNALLDAANRETEMAQQHAGALAKSEKRFHGAFSNAAIGMALVSSNGAILQVNPAVCKMLGYREDELMGGAIGAFMQARDFSALLNDIETVYAGKQAGVQREIDCIGKDGVRFGVAFNVSVFAEGAGGVPDLIVQMQDIRARKQAEAKLMHIAFHDTLTGLPNRAYFREQLSRVIARAKRTTDTQYALMFLDFDRFKAVNDSLGHAAGDELLIGFATRIKSVLRPTDTVARLGGDEFAVLVEDLRDDSGVIELAKRLQDTFRAPFRIQGTNITSSASIGIAFGADRYDTPDDIIRDADLAMYKAKAAGKAQYAVFDSSLYDRATAELQLENELRRAIEVGELRLHYQPQYSLRDRSLRGYEALVRWAHPTRGLLYPQSFLPIAEETGLIVPLGKWVLEEVCAQLKKMRQTEQGANLRMTINVSSRELRQQNFATAVLTSLSNAGVPAKVLSIELSERALIEGSTSALESLTTLRSAGVTFCIDDFGTGFSSLSHLANLPVDVIKIDRGFVHQAEQTMEAKEIVRAITSLGRALGKSVHVQGVETEAQWRVLVELGCDIAQGNVCSPPITATELNQMMASSRVLRAAI
jgi:diguanylate cyclase (GGDEF)-like protein/PAS domain S-box-containing protein